MQENTNRIIAFNSAILYVKMVVTTLCAILTTRYALNALGIVDFGLFSLLGGIISFVLILNTIMLSTTNRFIAVALGKGNIQEANVQFNVNLVIHVFLAIVTLILAIPIGEWYIRNYVNYNGDIETALNVYRISIIGACVSFIGVPYNGLLMAKEKFIVFCSTDILSHILKLAIAYSLMNHFEHKVLVYTFALSLFTAYPTIVFIYYCYKHYYEITKFRIIKDKEHYRRVFSFSGWVAYGAVATIGKNQGAAVLVNMFFTTAMNSALGVANNINAYIQMFSQNISNPIAPQLTKSYAIGNMDRCTNLLIISTKLSYLIILIVSSPFFIESEWLLSLWLGTVPPFASSFLILLIIDALCASLYQGVANIIFACGKIASYQFCTNTLRILSIVAAYFILKNHSEPYALFYAYISFSIIIFFIGQIILKRVVKIDISKLFKQSYIPSMIGTIICIPSLLISFDIHPFVHILIVFIYEILSIYFFVLSKKEKGYIVNIINHIKTKI